MLVLTRKSGESVYIGRGIEVTVLAVQGGRVKLGFAAPPEVSIRREEIPRPSVIVGERLSRVAARAVELAHSG